LLCIGGNKAVNLKAHIRTNNLAASRLQKEWAESFVVGTRTDPGSFVLGGTDFFGTFATNPIANSVSIP